MMSPGPNFSSEPSSITTFRYPKILTTLIRHPERCPIKSDQVLGSRPNTPLPQKLSAPGPQALFGALRQAPPAASCIRVASEVTVSVTVYLDNHDNLYEYSPRSVEANRSLPGDRLPVPEKAAVGTVFGKAREPNQSIHRLLG
jgi:hypothetical protein